MRRCKPRGVGLALVMVPMLFSLPACGPEGTGSIHADRSAASGVMLIPDRKEPGPPPSFRVGRPAPRPRAPRR
jgi:hypothetical protein